MSNARRIAAPDSFDLDAYEAEATREPFRFTYKGEDFELQHTQAIDWHELSNLNGAELVEVGLGPEQWERFNKLRLTAGGYKELQRRWFEHAGVSLGESKGSPSS